MNQYWPFVVVVVLYLKEKKFRFNLVGINEEAFLPSSPALFLLPTEDDVNENCVNSEGERLAE